MGYFFTHQYGSDFIMETCYECGIEFAFPKGLYTVLSREHKNFYCPKGHSQYYTGQSKEEKLKEQVERLEKICQARLNTINYVEKQFYGMKGYAAKLKKRISTHEK